MAIYRLCGVPGVIIVAGNGVGDTSISSWSSVAVVRLLPSTVEGELTLHLPSSAFFMPPHRVLFSCLDHQVSRVT